MGKRLRSHGQKGGELFTGKQARLWFLGALLSCEVYEARGGSDSLQTKRPCAARRRIRVAWRRSIFPPWLNLGFPGVLLNPLLAEIPAFQGWPHLSQPWDSTHDWDRFWMPLIARASPPPDPHGRVFHRSPPTPRLVPDSGGESTFMKITDYPLYNHAVPIEPAPGDHAWAGELAGEVAAELALSTASDKGWILRCPYAFEATWNGGPDPEDIDIRIEAPDAETPDFVQSRLGAGLLTFYPGYQFQTETPYSLWVRGTINSPKDGLHALEQIADTALLPCTVTVAWQCTRPHQTIRFAAGEPFGAILLYADGAQENAILGVVALDADADLEAYEQAAQQLVDDAAPPGGPPAPRRRSARRACAGGRCRHGCAGGRCRQGGVRASRPAIG